MDTEEGGAEKVSDTAQGMAQRYMGMKQYSTPPKQYAFGETRKRGE